MILGMFIQKLYLFNMLILGIIKEHFLDTQETIGKNYREQSQEATNYLKKAQTIFIIKT